MKSYGRAQFIGHQYEPGYLPVALFNVRIPGNKLDGSTVCIDMINKLGLTDLFDRDGNKLLAVPMPKRGVQS